MAGLLLRATFAYISVWAHATAWTKHKGIHVSCAAWVRERDDIYKSNGCFILPHILGRMVKLKDITSEMNC